MNNFGTKTVYCFNPAMENIYASQFDMFADWDQQGILSDSMTLVAPPSWAGPQIPQFNIDTKEWAVIPDYRFTQLWYKANANVVPCDLTPPGVTMESLDAIDVMPPEPFGYQWNDQTGAWEPTPEALAEAHHDSWVSDKANLLASATQAIQEHEDAQALGLNTVRTVDDVLALREFRLKLYSTGHGEELPAWPLR